MNDYPKIKCPCCGSEIKHSQACKFLDPGDKSMIKQLYMKKFDEIILKIKQWVEGEQK